MIANAADIPAYLTGLNDAQLAAATHGIGEESPGGPLLIIAGAGTGKTSTLAHRVAHLLAGGADPERLLLLTFSRRAADEMTRRVQRIAGRVSPRHARLVNAVEEAVQVQEEKTVASSPEMAAMLRRIELLESGLNEALRKLEALQANPPATLKMPVSIGLPAQTLRNILDWLATQEQVTLAVLRARLPPLDLLPGAVIDELNERALDLPGEIALEESGEEIVILKEVFATVIARAK